MSYIDYSCKIDESINYDPYLYVKKAHESFVWFYNDNRKFIDFLMGYSSTNFGHSNSYIVSHIKKIASKYDNIPALNSYDRLSLDEKIINRINCKCKNYKTYYTVGGAKAIEDAIKLARAYTRRKTIIVFEGAFHGYSYLAMSLSDDKFVNKQQFYVTSKDIKTFPYPDVSQDNSNYVCEQVLRNIKSFINQNYNYIAGIIFEPIQGASGYIQPPTHFLQDIQSIAKQYGILTICDEIQTCMGRFGSFIYTNQTLLEPDIILIGKSLAGGYYPLSTIIASEKIFDSITPKISGFGSTFSNNAFGISIANCVIDLLTEELYQSINLKGSLLKNKMDCLNKYDVIKKMNYIGLSCGIQTVSYDIAQKIRNEAFKNGLIIQTAGKNGDYLKISPSFYVSEQTIEEGIKRLIRTIRNIK